MSPKAQGQMDKVHNRLMTENAIQMSLNIGEYTLIYNKTNIKLEQGKNFWLIRLTTFAVYCNGNRMGNRHLRGSWRKCKLVGHCGGR